MGRELYGWLDGADGQLGRLMNEAPRPLIFEVRGPRTPSPSEWALLRAPFEVLANAQGFLAQDALVQFCPVRRLGQPTRPPALDMFRLGLAFMASAPRGPLNVK